MCLNVVYPAEKIPKGKFAYKVVFSGGGRCSAPIMGGRYNITGWNVDRKKRKIRAADGTMYPTGNHCFLRRCDAERWAGESYTVKRVEVRNIVAHGKQWVDDATVRVIVVREFRFVDKPTKGKR